MDLVATLRRSLKLLKRPKIVDLPVEFSADLDDQGKQVVTAYYNIDGQRSQVTDTRALFGYGYRLQANDVEYVPSLDTQNALAALHSLNPTFTDDGSMIVEVLPSVLGYLRGKKSLQETENSKALTIDSTPLKAQAEVSFDPIKGLQVDVGYRLEGKTGLVPDSALTKTSDGRFARLGNHFVPLEQPKNAECQDWLKRESVIVPLEKIPEFFKRDLVLIKSAFNAVLTDSTAPVRILDHLPKPVIRLDSREPGWLDFQVEYPIGDSSVPLELLRKAKAGYAHLGGGVFVPVEYKELDEAAKQLKEMGAVETDTGFRAPITCFASIEDFVQHIGGIKEVTAAYGTFLSELEGMKDDSTFQLPESVESRLRQIGIQLRPYQRSGIHWLDWLWRNRLHGILGDDMGLGKTLQSTLAMRLGYERALHEQKNQHSLIICPVSVIHHWYREIRRYFPEANVHEFHGPGRRHGVFSSLRATIFITSYATLARDVDTIRKVPLLHLILDEATQIKNAGAQRTEAAKALNAVHRVCLSGTPVENRPLELWSLFDFLMRGHLGAQSVFERRFEQPIMAGEKSIAEKLSKRIAPFILRRLKTDVAKDLPEKLQMTEWCELTEEQRGLYVGLQNAHKGIVERLKRGEKVDIVTNILPLLTKLKQVCDHPALVTRQLKPLEGRSNKFDMVVEKIKDIRDNGQQVVIFSHFLATLDLLQWAVENLDIRFIRIDGSTNNRQALIDVFNQGSAIVALCSIQACGHGVNLTGGNHVIHFDRWWNPAVEDQATDRVHRIGQDKTVYVYRILVQDTIEEKIDMMLERKRGIADLIVGGDLLSSKQLSRDELLEILQPLK